MHVTAENVGSEIAGAIPELRPSVEENEDLHHVTFGDLYRWTEESGRGGRIEDLERAVRLVDTLFANGDSYVRNAVTVSFLEYIDPADSVGRQIFDFLTPSLQKEWQELDEYMQQLVGKSLRGSVSRNLFGTRPE
jgi:hypothetical protein